MPTTVSKQEFEDRIEFSITVDGHDPVGLTCYKNAELLRLEYRIPWGNTSVDNWEDYVAAAFDGVTFT